TLAHIEIFAMHLFQEGGGLRLINQGGMGQIRIEDNRRMPPQAFVDRSLRKSKGPGFNKIFHLHGSWRLYVFRTPAPSSVGEPNHFAVHSANELSTGSLDASCL